MLIDGNSILNRAFYGLMGPKMLSNSEGLYTNAIFGFINILLKLLTEEKPTHILVAFDTKKPTFRHIQYEKYKAHRKGMPDELAMQMPVLKELLDAMNIKRMEMEGYEADDILGTYARLSNESGQNAVIVTGDKDALQLASKEIRIKIPTTRMGKTEIVDYDDEGVFNRYGVSPKEFIDVKALMGDQSDNIPGVPGIGEKTALELIKNYHSIENIYSNIETSEIKERTKNLLLDNKELAFVSKSLATIDTNIPVDLKVCDCDVKEYKSEELLKLLERLEFNSIIAKLNLSSTNKKSDKEFVLDFKELKTKDEISNLVSQMKKSKEFAYYISINKNSNQGELTGISLCFEEKKAYYINLNKLEKDTFGILFRELLESNEIKKYTFNVKPHYAIFNSKGIKLENVAFDIMIAAYLIDPAKEKYSLSELSKEFLNISIQDESVLTSCSIEAKEDSVSRFLCENASAVYMLSKLLNEKLKNDGQEKLYFEVELPLTKVLADMESIGVLVNDNELDLLAIELNGKIETLTKEILELAGEEFNINSTKQLGVILFEKLSLPVIRKTKTGYSTDAEVLESLSGKHPIIEKISEYRQLVKLKSTYIDGLKNVINPKTKRIHSSFNQTVTVTGRISSTEPNLQNIPIKLEMGKRVRKVFVAPEGYSLVDADYSQIELRVLAAISSDKNMIEAFKNNKDIHRITAAEVFKVDEGSVTSLMRSRAKTINFGIVYGMGDFSLAKDLKVTKKQAKEYIEKYFEEYNGVHEYMTNIIKKGLEQNYVTTLLGRRRYLPELHSKNFNIRSFGERVAMNTPIQGTAADIIKIAMVKVYNELNKRNLSSRLILQVHDELIIETKNEELDEVKNLLKDCMENAIELSVPLEVDINSGASWYETK